MNKRFGMILLSAFVLAASVFTFSRQVNRIGLTSKVHVRSVSKAQFASVPNPTTTVSKATTTPEHVYYNHVFHHINSLKKKAEDEESRSRNGHELRTLYQRQTSLSDAQSAKLDEIAADCVRIVARQDEKAKRIIDQFRARYPGGKIPQGEQLPPPPPQLQIMQDERNLMILRARERLRSALGEQAFSRFDGFVKKTVMINTEPTLGNSLALPSTTQRLKQRIHP